MQIQEVSYPVVCRQLIRMRRMKGSPIPLTQSVKMIEKQMGVILDIPRIKRALTGLGHADEMHIQRGDVLKVIDIIT